MKNQANNNITVEKYRIELPSNTLLQNFRKILPLKENVRLGGVIFLLSFCYKSLKQSNLKNYVYNQNKR